MKRQDFFEACKDLNLKTDRIHDRSFGPIALRRLLRECEDHYVENDGCTDAESLEVFSALLGGGIGVIQALYDLDTERLVQEALNLRDHQDANGMSDRMARMQTGQFFTVLRSFCDVAEQYALDPVKRRAETVTNATLLGTLVGFVSCSMAAVENFAEKVEKTQI